MRIIDTLLIVLPFAAAFLTATGVLVAGGSFVEASTNALSTFLILGIGVGIVKWLWKNSDKRLGRKQVTVAVLFLLVIAAAVGCLTGGGEWVATTMMATLSPTPTMTVIPLEEEIKASASATEVADLWIELNYGKGNRRGKLPGSEGLVAQEGSIDSGELWVITATLDITPTQIVRDPMATLQYISSQHYTVIPDGETRHVRSIIISSEIRVEVYELPPMEIMNGDRKEITQIREAYVIVHLIPPPSVGEIGRDNWLVAGMMLVPK